MSTSKPPGAKRQGAATRAAWADPKRRRELLERLWPPERRQAHSEMLKEAYANGRKTGFAPWSEERKRAHGEYMRAFWAARREGKK